MHTQTISVVQVDEVLEELLESKAEKCTIVHCSYTTSESFTGIRIWPETVLIQNDGTRRKLIKAFNISLMPEWTYIEGSVAKFTLVFEGLTSVCTSFNLLEEIFEPFGFYSKDVERNELDVYRVEVFC